MPRFRNILGLIMILAISLYTSNFGVATKKLNVRAFILSGPGTMYLSQWRSQKIFMGGVSFSGIRWSFVCGVQSL